MRSEQIGAIAIIGSISIWGFFPIIANYSARFIPPVLFAGVSTLTTGIVLFFYLLARGDFNKKLFNRRAVFAISMNTILSIILAFIFIFIGASLTSAINTALLLQTELLFTFLILGIFFGEKITRQKIGGGLIVLVGATAILFNGSFSLNIGDLLIVIGTIFYPFGNRYAKQALELTSPAVLIFLRGILGGVFLIIFSLLFESHILTVGQSIKDNLPLILVQGIIIMGFSKFIWFEGFKRLSITRSIAIGMAQPAFSLVYAFLLLGEVPNVYQITGLFVIIGGVYMLTRADPKHVSKSSSTQPNLLH